MNIQLILTYFLIVYALGYTCYHLIKLIISNNSSCGGSCGGCDFKKELKKRGINSKSFKPTDDLTYINNNRTCN